MLIITLKPNNIVIPLLCASILPTSAYYSYLYFTLYPHTPTSVQMSKLKHRKTKQSCPKSYILKYMVPRTEHHTQVLKKYTILSPFSFNWNTIFTLFSLRLCFGGSVKLHDAN